MIAAGASGVLRAFNDAGVLEVSDVHVASALGKLGGEPDERVLLAVALTVRALRAGSVCLELSHLRDVAVDGVEVGDLPWPDGIVEAVRTSPLLSVGGERTLAPLTLVDDELLYLVKYYEQEETIRRILAERELTQPPSAVPRGVLEELFPGKAPDRQRVAAGVAASRWTTVLAGGPGTGKTHTVARILASLARENPAIRIGLAAPTGKAAARLQESVREQSKELDLPAMSAVTLHRLLGWRSGGRYTYNAANHLPYDIVVVDESSMVPLTMMCRLLEALRPQARLVLVGDPDQLASVDAGAVLADLVARPGSLAELPESVFIDLDAPDSDEPAIGADERRALQGGVVELTRGRRFKGAIADLAAAVRAGDSATVLDLLRDQPTGISFGDEQDLDELRADAIDSAKAASVAATNGDAASAIAAMDRHRLLCAHRDGRYGATWWDRRVREWVGANESGWYPGQPLLVTANDYDVKVYNGDTGVVVERDGQLFVAFERGSEPLVVHPSRLSAVQTVYAMTVHRAQGSQYDTVSVVLPGEKSALLTRELLYTAITRAKNHVRLIGTESAVRAAVERRVLRASGLRR